MVKAGVRVVKKDRSTTKVQVVFNAAAQGKAKNVNDAILLGPKVQ